MDGIVLGLWGSEQLANEAGVLSSKGDFSGASLAYNTRSEVEVDEVLEAAKKAGDRIVKPAQHAFWGGW